MAKHTFADIIRRGGDGLPVMPRPAAFYRRFRTLRDALRYYAADSHGSRALRAARRLAVNPILEALSQDSGIPALEVERAIQRFKETDDFRGAVRHELKAFVRPLVDLYENPESFFSDPPSPYRRQFDARHMARPGGLEDIFWTWGMAAMLSPAVREAFERASPERKVHIFGLVENRVEYREGRPQGRRDSKLRSRRAPKPRPPKVDHEARLRAVRQEADRWRDETYRERGAVKEGVRRAAEREGVATGTIRSSMKRAKSRGKKSS